MSPGLQQSLARWQRRTGQAGACHAERRAFLTFCLEHQLPATPDAVALYLVHLHDERPRTASALRYRLRLLDLAAALAGEPRPSADPGLRRFLRGLHRSLAAGADTTRRPLYVEDVDALLHAVDRDRGVQARESAFVLLSWALPVPPDQLRQLQWHQVRFRKSAMLLTLPHYRWAKGPRGRLTIEETTKPTCPVLALRTWSRLAGPANGYVFTSRAARPMSKPQAARLLAPLPTRPDSAAAAGGDDDTLVMTYVDSLREPTVRQLRDRSLISLAFAACLTTEEARELRVRHVEQVRQGLLVHLPGRARTVAVPRAAVAARCPVSAWTQWLACLHRHTADQPDGFAWPWVRDRYVGTKPMGPFTPGHVLDVRCEQAGLRAEYSFLSLRIGFIRSAARAGVPEQVISQQAGLGRLNSVALHVQRERLLSHNAAAMVGL